jgi:phosphatidylserine/phosphatidylglycerophosphate/cardiolipin synthase-like enzyme
MRIRKQSDGISVHAVSGTYVVTLGMNATTAEARNGLLGFAIRRIDKTENQQYWMRGMRTFASVYPNPPAGALVSSHEHPIQDFLWSDFTAKAAHEYVYEVHPVRGEPKNPDYGTPVIVPVSTEQERDGNHEVWFNRGVIGSQAYAREFGNKDPQKLKGRERERAYEWLSRGLFEAMRDFIRRAKTKKFGIRAAVYEFSYEPIIAEFRDARKRCGDVQIIYDARIKKSHGKPDKQASGRVALTRRLLKKYGLGSESIARARRATPNAIAHNKFIVLLENGKPTAVWTGSTNFTESGIFGQANVGHAVEDDGVAKSYLDYWKRLYADPEVPSLRKLNCEAGADLKDFPPPRGITPIFSPRLKDSQKRTILNWYASSAMSGAKNLMCFTAAFGVNELFMLVLERNWAPTDDLRYLFLNKWGLNPGTSDVTQERLKKNRYNVVAVGGYLVGDVLHEYLMDRWRKERSNTLSKNVRYTHTKYMLVDPLGEDPIVISGSANFSNASTISNDENMLIIRGDKRVADIYLGEFMRLWQHYRFRSIVDDHADEPTGHRNDYTPKYLSEDDSWTEGFFRKGYMRCKRREVFC